jgi:hypothetical protein
MARRPAKAKVKVKAPTRVRKSALKDPSWAGYETWTGLEFHKFKQAASDYYYQNYKASDLNEFTFQWMLNNGYTKDDVRCAKADKTYNLSQPVGYVCRMLDCGMPDYYKPHDEHWQSCPGTSGEIKPVIPWIKEKIDAAIEGGKPHVAEAKAKVDAEKAKKPYKPTIQELMFEASCNMTEEIEEFIDSFITETDPNSVKTFDPLKLLRKVECKMGHARQIRKFYEGSLDEMIELNTKVGKRDMDDMREQLEEGYAIYDTKQKKALLEVYRKIVDACDIVIAESKASRKPRKSKVRTANDIVKKLKFKASDADYGIASVVPTDIIGANILVVFNTRNRKLGMYYASNIDPKGFGREGTGLSVKGTTIIGYDEKKSLQRTIRKPSEFLPQIKKTTRAKTEKLFDTLKTTETKLNGRINSETILIAAFNK